MIIHILIPNFWIVVEEQRRPDLSERPVIVSAAFLQKAAAHSSVLMANELARSYGVQPGASLAHARQLCPEALILSPELPLYQGIWDDVMALLLTYTPLVQSIEPGEAVCDVSGCERLFGEPVFLAHEMVERIGTVMSLPARAGVGSNRLVARLAALAERSDSERSHIVFVAPGQEAAFLSPLPITALPGIDPNTLISFQVLGLKKIGDLSLISEAAMERRFGGLGGQLARYARGCDDRPVLPTPEAPSLKVSRCCDVGIDGLEPHPNDDRALDQLVESLASDLSSQLREKRLAGRLLALMLKAPREVQDSRFKVQGLAESLGGSGAHSRLGAQRPEVGGRVGADNPSGPPASGNDQVFPNQDLRIHSMLPTPRQPGRSSSLAPTSVAAVREGATESKSELPDPTSIVKTMTHMATSRPVNDRQTLIELARRLLFRMLSTMSSSEVLAQPGAELQLEMRHFAPPEQMMLPGLDVHPSRRSLDPGLNRLHRQENILASRFGVSPFRHLEGIDLDSILEERKFRWGNGMGR